MKLDIKYRGLTRLIYVVLVLLYSSGCKKFIEVKPPTTSVNEGIVFGSDASATAVLNGIYTKMSTDGIISGITALSLYPALSADELTLWSEQTTPKYIEYFQNNIRENDSFWIELYAIIFKANSAIEGLTSSKTLTPQVKTHLLGEAKFMRAFCYFYLVNLYGDVPLALKSDYKVNSNLPRTAKKDVYAQMIQDLSDAKSLLVTDYVDGSLIKVSDERITPNKAAVSALLARVYLYSNDFAHAEQEATEVIDQHGKYDLVDLDKVFLINSKEAIWQLKSVNTTFATNTTDAILFTIPAELGPNTTNENAFPTGGNWVYLTNSLKNAFEPNDKRKSTWLDSVSLPGATYAYPAKYKNYQLSSAYTERVMILRLAEQYLIRAEARTKTGNLGGAVEDINSIRERAGLLPIDGTTDLLTVILHERRVELFTEWGNRWFDLKRIGNIDDVMGKEAITKGASWKSTAQLYPINFDDIKLNPNLIQNPGY